MQAAIDSRANIGLSVGGFRSGALVGRSPQIFAFARESLLDAPTGGCQQCPVRPLSVCSGLQRPEFRELEAVARRSNYRDRAILFDEESGDAHVHVVTAGVVRLFKILADGRRAGLGFALPGDFLALSSNGAHVCSAEAVGSVSTCKISRGDFVRLLDAKPNLRARLHDETINELSLARDQIVLLSRYSARERVAAFLVNLRKRWKRVNGQTCNVALPMTRQDIGDFLGLTIETVCRTLTALAREKLILIVPDGVRILDLARLETLAAG